MDSHGSGLISAETAESNLLSFVDTVWTNGVHNYAEYRVNTRVSASDLFRRRALLRPFRSNEIRSGPWLVRNAEVTSSSLVSSTNLRSREHAEVARRSAKREGGPVLSLRELRLASQPRAKVGRFPTSTDNQQHGER